jgi:hypothetical protein
VTVDQYKTAGELRAEAAARSAAARAQRADAAMRGADVDYGRLNLADQAIRDAAEYDHARGVRHRGLPCCEGRP